MLKQVFESISVNLVNLGLESLRSLVLRTAIA